MSALARELVGRGHEAVFIAQADAGPRLSAAGLPFHPVGEATHPAGTLAGTERRMTGRIAPLNVVGTVRAVAQTTDMLIREGEPVLRSLGIDAVVADQMEAAGGLLAEHLELPFVSVANALLINRDENVPPPYTGWRYDDSAWGRRRNQGGYSVSDRLMRPVERVLADWSARWHLPPRRGIEDCLSPFAQITQTVPGFDHPRLVTPPVLHSCGPLRAEPSSGGGGLSRTDGRPLVYASLGTLLGARIGVFRTIAEACRRLDLALLVAHGGRLSPGQTASLAGAPEVHAFVPQLDILPRAALAITNGGLNTVLDALTFGVPVIAIPLAFEQGAIASRLVRSGTGAAIRPLTLSTGRLARLAHGVLSDPAYARRAAAIGAEIAEAGGVTRAADIVERVVRTGRPVTRADMTIAELQA